MVARKRRSFHAGSDSQGNGLAGLSPKISFLGERTGIDLGKNDRATGRLSVDAYRRLDLDLPQPAAADGRMRSVLPGNDAGPR